MLQIEWISDSTATEVVLLGIAFVLSALIGLERHRKLKSAGLRTHTLVGLGAAAFTLVSSYGFAAVMDPNAILDPSRIAAQIVSGIGFLGAGVIFVRQNAVTGLTTAASIWVTASVGMACGAGLPVLAIAATAFHFCGVWLLGFVGRWIRVDDRERTFLINYKEGDGALRAILASATDMGFEALVTDTRKTERPGKSPRVQATLRFRNGHVPIERLLEQVAEIPGVISAQVAEADNE